MSLEALRELRRSGAKPDGLVKVVVGKRCAYDDCPDVISVSPSDRPLLMDWRAVVGLPLALFVCDGAEDQAERVLDAALAVNCKPFGACWSDGPVCSHEPSRRPLMRMWELLCL
jgi:hypothetical protein